MLGVQDAGFSPVQVGVLLVLGRFSPLLTEQVCCACGLSPRWARRTLSILARRGAVDRRSTPNRARLGRPQLLSSITRTGLRTLKDAGVSSDPVLSARCESGLAHHLSCANVALSILTGAAGHCLEPRFCPTTIGGSECRPDLHAILSRDGRATRLLIEVDLGTEPIRSSHLANSVERKLVAYASLLDAAMERPDILGAPMGFRLLVVTTGQARLQNIYEAVQDVVAGDKGFVWLGLLDSTGGRFLSSATWQSCGDHLGSRKSLISGADRAGAKCGAKPGANPAPQSDVVKAHPEHRQGSLESPPQLQVPCRERK